MVVAGAGFVQGGGSGRFELAEQVDVGQVRENDVNGLDCNGGDALAYGLHNGFCGGVRVVLHGVEYGESLLGDSASSGA